MFVAVLNTHFASVWVRWIRLAALGGYIGCNCGAWGLAGCIGHVQLQVFEALVAGLDRLDLRYTFPRMH